MPAWLSPRVRLGVSVSLIVLIACAILLTPYLLHDDSDTPDFLTQSASVDLFSEPPASATQRPPSRLITLPASAWPPSHDVVLRNEPDSPASYSESDSSPDAPPDPVVDWLGQNPLAAQGIAWPLSDCLDCSSTPRQRSQFTHPLFFEIVSGGGPGGGGGGGSAVGPDPLPPITVTDFAPPTDQGNGPGDQDGPSTSDGPNPPSNPRRPTGPGPNGPNEPGDPNDPNEPDPQPTDVVQVPEPSAFVMAGAGALGFLIRARSTRKRRG